MIAGIGADVCEIARIARLLDRFGQRFLERVFAPEERGPPERLAKRWAAKEACAKAIGTGIGIGAFWRDITVVNDSSGKPFLRLSGRALSAAEKVAGKGFSTHLSMSDDGGTALAFVVLESAQSMKTDCVRKV